MSMDRKPEQSPITQLDFLRIIDLLSEDVTDIEQEILQHYYLSKSKPDADLLLQYKHSLKAVADMVFDISKAIFQKTNLSEVSRYLSPERTKLKDNQASGMPKSFQRYLNASHNMKDLVLYDILKEQNVINRLIIFERWIFISKAIFELNDFFGLTSIASAFVASDLSKANLEPVLSDVSKGVYDYFTGSLLINPGIVYRMEHACLDGGVEMVPMLSTLAKMFEGFANHPDSADAKERDDYIRRSKRSLSSKFNIMQTRLSVSDSASVEGIVALLSKESNLAFSPTVFVDDASNDQVGSRFSRFWKQVHPYERADQFYCYLADIKKHLSKVSQLASAYFKEKDTSKAANAKYVACDAILTVLRDSEETYQSKVIRLLDLKSCKAYRQSKTVKAAVKDAIDLFETIVQIETERSKKILRRYSSGSAASHSELPRFKVLAPQKSQRFFSVAPTSPEEEKKPENDAVSEQSSSF